jgi:hypothetical protein
LPKRLQQSSQGRIAGNRKEIVKPRLAHGLAISNKTMIGAVRAQLEMTDQTQLGCLKPTIPKANITTVFSTTVEIP